MKYKIIETEKGQREKVYKGNTMLYKKTKIEHDSNITEYEMVVTYYEANIEFGVFIFSMILFTYAINISEIVFGS